MSGRGPTSGDRPPVELPLTEWIVLALLDEGPRHGFALARELRPPSPLGRVWTVSRPLTYRAVDQLVSKGLARPARREASGDGPTRTIVEPTPAGSAAVRPWLTSPAAHLREVRSELLVKLLLLERAGVDRRPLLRAQLDTFAPMFEVLAAESPSLSSAQGAIDLWRQESAKATERMLRALLDADGGEVGGRSATRHSGPAR